MSLDTGEWGDNIDPAEKQRGRMVWNSQEPPFSRDMEASAEVWFVLNTSRSVNLSERHEDLNDVCLGKRRCDDAEVLIPLWESQKHAIVRLTCHANNYNSVDALFASFE
jgi:hypothetical protein